MDDQTDGVKPEGETETTPTTTPVEEQTAETIEVPEESKKGYSQRVQELANAKKAAEDRAESLETKLAALTSQVGTTGFTGFTPPTNQFDEDTEKKLVEREQRLQQSLEFRLQQERAINRIQRESSEIVKTYPQLDPDSDEFDPLLSKDITDAAEEYVKANPSGSVKGFVTKMMKPIVKNFTKEAKQTEKVIAKQASQGAIRSSQTKPVDKPDSEKSIAEMEAELGFFQG
jgi:hypothetical protein